MNDILPASPNHALANELIEAIRGFAPQSDLHTIQLIVRAWADRDAAIFGSDSRVCQLLARVARNLSWCLKVDFDRTAVLRRECVRCLREVAAVTP